MEAKAESSTTGRVIEFARIAKATSRQLAVLSTEQKNEALRTIARRVGERSVSILEANKKDLDRTHPLVESGELARPLYSRLKLDEEKLAGIIGGIEQVARLEDPVGRLTLATELDEGLRLYRVNCPIGVVGIIFESRPDALAQISSLALKSGNAVLLKGGSEAEQTNRALFSAIHDGAIDAGVPPGVMALLESREDVKELLRAEGLVDLIVPRGSNALVRYIQENTRIPVLGHSEGICHVYVDRAAAIEKALNITIDAKVSYPAVCNAVETLLVHSEIAPRFLPLAAEALKKNGVEVRCERQAIQKFGIQTAVEATSEDWSAEYCDLILAIKVVDSMDQAIEHINKYGSHHTDAIVTEDTAAFDRFFAEVDSAGVYLNASTRFADGYRYGFGAEVGISTGKLHPRGPVGLDGLVTYKYKLVGDGHTVGAYSGPSGKKLNHRPLSAE
ncbi:MAG TPA: glutamate-5-semialdehyde dehydrogenase [Blastocatellia bacterium]|nr:glutamate-5-semialdehyde dehydrogenase [Blastocatellia bacterium]